MKYILLSDSEKQDIIRLRKEGETLREISEYIGCAINTVAYHIKMNKKIQTPCFSSRMEFMAWQDKNCRQCKKATWYSERLKRYPKLRCTVQKEIELQADGIGNVSLRTYKATQQAVCPYLKKNINGNAQI